MIYQAGKTQIDITVTPALKKTIRLYVQRAYGLATCPHTRLLKKMFNLDMRLNMSWLTIFATCEDKLGYHTGETQREYNERIDREWREAAKKYSLSLSNWNYASLGCDVYMADAAGVMRFIGCLSTSHISQDYFYSVSRRGNSIKVRNISQAMHILIAIFKKG